MKKIDFKKELKNLYNASAKEAVIVEVPRMNFLMVDGKGDPNNSLEFKEAVEVLYALSYNLKFAVKKGALAIDYGVLPLEGLWWADDMTKFNTKDKSIWKWTLMIMQPEYVTTDLFVSSSEEVRKKKNPPALSKVRFENFQEGSAAQIMHIGSYSEEEHNIKKLHARIDVDGNQLTGKHHEIYLSDPMKTAPEKLKTILRQPFHWK